MRLMERCESCYATLQVGEKECWGCSAPVRQKNTGTSMHERFQSLIKVLFILFAVLTPLSLVLPDGYVPSFKKCGVGLIVMLLARSSIQAMTDHRRS